MNDDRPQWTSAEDDQEGMGAVVWMLLATVIAGLSALGLLLFAFTPVD